MENLTHRDMLLYIRAHVDQFGLLSHNLESYDEFIVRGIPEIVESIFNIDRIVANKRDKTEEDLSIKNFQIQGTFNNASVAKPMYNAHTGYQKPLFPRIARKTGHGYASMLTMGARFIITAHKVDGTSNKKVIDIPPFQVAEIPTMVGGINCHTKNCSKTALKQIGEDPTDGGGYFIFKRNEYGIDPTENIRYNTPHFHLAVKPTEHQRMLILSQPSSAFENSSQLSIFFMKNGQLNIGIHSAKFEDVVMPFYIVYRLLGMTSDKDITDSIVNDHTDTSLKTELMMNVIETAFHLSDSKFEELKYSTDKSEIITFVANKLSRYVAPGSNSDDKIVSQHKNQDIMGNSEKNGVFDEVFLPHIGRKKEHRMAKLRYLGQLIHKMLLVHFGVSPPTDRDNWAGKRVHCAGISIAKGLKSKINSGVVHVLLNSFRHDLENNTWSSLTEQVLSTSARNSISSSDISNEMEQMITTSTPTNRLTAQALERKNSTNVLSTQRNISSSDAVAKQSKQTERADKRRRVRSEADSLFCPNQTAESGDGVGMKKQLAITATISSAKNPEPLRQMIITDPDVVLIEEISNKQIASESLATIFINGKPIGVCKNAVLFALKYIDMKRKQIIHPETTISYDIITSEVSFSLDVGRVIRPAIVVYNNLKEYDENCMAIHKSKLAKDGKKIKKIEFDQYIKFTIQHVKDIIAGKISFDYLVKNGIAEYVSAEENILAAPSIDNVRKSQHDITIQYTHCDIPTAGLGLIAMLSPYANFTQPSRISISTAHTRQACGWFAANFSDYFTQNRFMMYHCEMPLTKTFAYDCVKPDGYNCIVAVQIKDGENQEDSAIWSKATSDRGALAGSFYRAETVDIERGELIQKPNPVITEGIRPGTNFNKLDDRGIIKLGSIVMRNDAVVAKVLQNTNNKDYEFTNKTVVYKIDEPARVIKIEEVRGPKAELFIIIKYEYYRTFKNGDKMSSRSGNKCIGAKLQPESDMPYTANGLTPDVIINPHSFPSRMPNGQVLEQAVGLIAASDGTIADGTAFMPLDHYEVQKRLVEKGFRSSGCTTLYNGKTGEPYNVAIFIGPTYILRLLKFVLDDEQSVGITAPLNPETGQPLGGKQLRGGLKIDEMTVWGMESHGIISNLHEKFSTMSDGRNMYICRGCGKQAVHNEFMNIYACATCGDYASINEVPTTKTALKLMENLNASNVPITLGLEPLKMEHDCRVDR